MLNQQETYEKSGIEPSVDVPLRLGCESGAVTCSVKSLDLPAAAFGRPSSTRLRTVAHHFFVLLYKQIDQLTSLSWTIYASIFSPC